MLPKNKLILSHQAFTLLGRCRTTMDKCVIDCHIVRLCDFLCVAVRCMESLKDYLQLKFMSGQRGDN